MPSIRRASETTVSLVRISPRRGAAAEPGGQVQGAAAVAALDRDGLARVEPDPDPERQGRCAVRSLPEEPLQLDRGADRLPCRREDAERLVAAQLEQLSALRLDPPARELGEAGGEPRCLLVSLLLRVARVAAYVGDQEGTQRGRGAARALQAPRRSFLPRHVRAKGTRSSCERKARRGLLYVSAGSRAAPARCAFRRRIAFVCSCDTRDSVTPSTSPTSRSVSSSK